MLPEAFAAGFLVIPYIEASKEIIFIHRVCHYLFCDPVQMAVHYVGASGKNSGEDRHDRSAHDPPTSSSRDIMSACILDFSSDSVGRLNGIFFRLLCVPVVVVSVFRQLCFAGAGYSDRQAKHSVAQQLGFNFYLAGYFWFR